MKNVLSHFTCYIIILVSFGLLSIYLYILAVHTSNEVGLQNHQIQFEEMFEKEIGASFVPTAKIAFITAVFGPYELNLQPYPKQTIPADFIAFTDFSSLKNNGNEKHDQWIIDSNPYHIFNPSKVDTHNYTNSLVNNNHTFNVAKYYKQSFQNIPRLKQYDVVVWLDGTIQIKTPFAAEWLLKNTQKHHIVVAESPLRKGKLSAEVVGSVTKSRRYHTTFWFNQSQPFQNVTAQYEAYLSNGYNESLWQEKAYNTHNNTSINYGMWTTCLVAFHNHNEQVSAFLNFWYLQTLMYTTQDQISFPYAVQRTGVSILTLPGYGVVGSAHNNTLFEKHRHGYKGF